jgi:hypothetical protein
MFYDRLRSMGNSISDGFSSFKTSLSNGLSNAGNSISNSFVNGYNSVAAKFGPAPTALQSSGLSQIQVPVESTPAVTVNPYHATGLTVDKMLTIKRNAPGFADAISGIPPGTTSCSDGGVNMKCPPTLPVDRALNRVFDMYYGKK